MESKEEEFWNTTTHFIGLGIRKLARERAKKSSLHNKKLENVIAIIEGSEKPEEYVVISRNHNPKIFL